MKSQDNVLEKVKDYTASITVSVSPREAFNSINNVTKWWTEELTGQSQKLNDEFTVRFFDDVHVSTQRLVELIPDNKIVWLVTDSKLNFIKDKSEWTNTKISFEISNHDNQTQINFTHIGLGPQVECFNDCSKGWDHYFKGSLFKLLTEGKGMPELK